jgi:hypothetical protein
MYRQQKGFGPVKIDRQCSKIIPSIWSQKRIEEHLTKPSKEMIQ